MPSSNELTNLDTRVRRDVYDTIMSTGRAPSVAEIASVISVPLDDVRQALQRLADAHMMVLQPTSGEILMANPFSAVPTSFPVESGSVSYWGNCIWDALGIPAMLGQDATIRTACPDCGEGMEVSVRLGSLEPSEGIIHFAIPAKHWWDNIVYT